MRIIHHSVATPNVHRVERWASVLGGGALAAYGVRKASLAGAAIAVAGGALVARGLTGYCQMYKALGIRTAPKGDGASGTSIPYELGVWAEASVTIAKPRAEIYRFWRDLTNLPKFMHHLESVEVHDRLKSHWVACGPAGKKVEWEAEIINEIPNELVAWRSLPGSDVDSAGSVRFRDAADGETEIHVELQYNPPAGLVGAYVARLFGREPEQEIRTDLAELKRYLEAGRSSASSNARGSQEPVHQGK